MNEVTYKFVPRRVLNRDGTSSECSFLWRIEHRAGRPVRRTVLNYDTGEIIDDVWLDADGRVRSYSRPRQYRESG